MAKQHALPWAAVALFVWHVYLLVSIQVPMNQVFLFMHRVSSLSSSMQQDAAESVATSCHLPEDSIYDVRNDVNK